MAFPLADAVVEECLRDGNPLDAAFATAYYDSLAALPRETRPGALGGIVGHVAEAVIESELHELGYHPLWDLEGPGRHGIDLAMLSPALESTSLSTSTGWIASRRNTAHGPCVVSRMIMWFWTMMVLTQRLRHERDEARREQR
jgi:hypothetical protein